MAGVLTIVLRVYSLPFAADSVLVAWKPEHPERLDFDGVSSLFKPLLECLKLLLEKVDLRVIKSAANHQEQQINNDKLE